MVHLPAGLTFRGRRDTDRCKITPIFRSAEILSPLFPQAASASVPQNKQNRTRLLSSKRRALNIQSASAKTYSFCLI